MTWLGITLAANATLVAPQPVTFTATSAFKRRQGGTGDRDLRQHDEASSPIAARHIISTSRTLSGGVHEIVDGAGQPRR